MYVETSQGTPMRGLWGASGTASSDGAGDSLLGAFESDEASSLGGNADVIYKLIHAVENTHFSPVLLPYPADVVDRATGLVVAQTALIDELVQQEQADNAEQQEQTLIPFKRSDMAKYEIQRVQFLLCELLRCRLQLIEKLCFAIAHEAASSVPDGEGGAVSGPKPYLSSSSAAGASASPLRRPYAELLSPNERAIAARLAQLKHAAMLASGLRNVPEALQHLVPALPHGEGPEILPVVAVDRHVFVYLLQDMEGPIELAPDVSETMSRGEIFLVPFSSLGHFVADGRARLI